MQKNVFFLKQLQWGMNHGALGYRQCQCCIGFCLCLLGEMYPLFPNFRPQPSPHSFIDFQQPPSTCPAVYPSSFSLIFTHQQGGQNLRELDVIGGSSCIAGRIPDHHSLPVFPVSLLEQLGEFSGLLSLLRSTEVAHLCLHNEAMNNIQTIVS